MERKIRYHEAAFKHGIEKEDIEWAIKTQVFNETLIDDDAEIAVGFSRAANLLEIGFREFDDGTLFVFHADNCQKKWRIKARV
ncbi:hypothetical protein AGMMS49546_37570 [Spirochaetia bacterium]|nr:hypothetical protein AGMMS49546_37570 [Spirochaetia bacterium]